MKSFLLESFINLNKKMYTSLMYFPFTTELRVTNIFYDIIFSRTFSIMLLVKLLILILSELIECDGYNKKNQVYAVFCTQQGKPREPSVKTLRSPPSIEFRRHCVLSGGTQRRALPRNQSEETKI